MLRSFLPLTLAVALAACGQRQDPESASQLREAADASPGVIAQNATDAQIKAYMAALLSADKRESGLGLAESNSHADATAAAAVWNGYDMGVTPTVYTQSELDQAFELVRETRFQQDGDRNNRRMSWLYPDDGCFTRAVLMNYLISERLSLTGPTHVFSFGSKLEAQEGQSQFASDLTVLTTNHPNGSVSWWYHIAPVVSVGGVSYVLDPAVHAAGPITLQAWLDAQKANGGHVSGSVICDANSYVPGSKCTGDPDHTDEAKALQRSTYLPAEWNRQIELNHVAKDVLLGEHFTP